MTESEEKVNDEVGAAIDLGIDGLSDVRPIGSGGFATVYAATEDRFGRTRHRPRTAQPVLRRGPGKGPCPPARHCGPLRRTPTEPIVFDDHESSIVSMAVLGDGRLVTASLDNTARVLDPNDPDAEPVVFNDHSALLHDVIRSRLRLSPASSVWNTHAPGSPRSMKTLPIRRPRADVQRDLAIMVSGRAPFLSVYLDLSPGEARATASSRLSAAFTDRLDAPDELRVELGETLERMHAALAASPADDALFVAVADADGRLLTASYPDPPRTDVIEVSSVPRLGPLLAAEQSLTHHVVAIINGQELTLLTVPRHGEPEQSSYTGQDPLSIAPIVQHASRVSETNLLVVCAPTSDLTAVSDQIRTGLPIDVNMATVPLDDLDLTQLATEIVVRTADHAASRTVELLRLYRFHQSHDEVADGAPATCGALTGGRAALVLVNDDVSDHRVGWLGPTGEDGRAPVQVDEPPSAEGWRRGRLADVVIGAALMAECGVHVVPRVGDTLADGIGAILADRATPSDLSELLEY